MAFTTITDENGKQHIIDEKGKEIVFGKIQQTEQEKIEELEQEWYQPDVQANKVSEDENSKVFDKNNNLDNDNFLNQTPNFEDINENNNATINNINDNNNDKETITDETIENNKVFNKDDTFDFTTPKDTIEKNNIPNDSYINNIRDVNDEISHKKPTETELRSQYLINRDLNKFKEISKHHIKCSQSFINLKSCVSNQLAQIDGKTGQYGFNQLESCFEKNIKETKDAIEKNKRELQQFNSFPVNGLFPIAFLFYAIRSAYEEQKLLTYNILNIYEAKEQFNLAQMSPDEKERFYKNKELETQDCVSSAYSSIEEFEKENEDDIKDDLDKCAEFTTHGEYHTAEEMLKNDWLDQELSREEKDKIKANLKESIAFPSEKDLGTKFGDTEEIDSKIEENQFNKKTDITANNANIKFSSYKYIKDELSQEAQEKIEANLETEKVNRLRADFANLIEKNQPEKPIKGRVKLKQIDQNAYKYKNNLLDSEDGLKTNADKLALEVSDNIFKIYKLKHEEIDKNVELLQEACDSKLADFTLMIDGQQENKVENISSNDIMAKRILERTTNLDEDTKNKLGVEIKKSFNEFHKKLLNTGELDFDGLKKSLSENTKGINVKFAREVGDIAIEEIDKERLLNKDSKYILKYLGEIKEMRESLSKIAFFRQNFKFNDDLYKNIHQTIKNGNADKLRIIADALPFDNKNFTNSHTNLAKIFDKTFGRVKSDEKLKITRLLPNRLNFLSLYFNNGKEVNNIRNDFVDLHLSKDLEQKHKINKSSIVSLIKISKNPYHFLKDVTLKIVEEKRNIKDENGVDKVQIFKKLAGGIFAQKIGNRLPQNDPHRIIGLLLNAGFNTEDILKMPTSKLSFAKKIDPKALLKVFPALKILQDVGKNIQNINFNSITEVTKYFDTLKHKFKFALNDVQSYTIPEYTLQDKNKISQLLKFADNHDEAVKFIKEHIPQFISNTVSKVSQVVNNTIELFDKAKSVTRTKITPK